MADPIQRFEDLVAWQKAKELRRQIVRLIDSGRLGRDFDLIGQLRSAATSVMGNIAEGFERTGAREFMHGLSMARGSCAEVRSHIHAALDSGYITQAQFEALYTRAEEVSKVIAALRKGVLKSHAKRQARRPPTSDL